MDAFVIKNATVELKRLSQKGFQECSQQLYSRWQKCIVVKGDCFEGSVAYVIVYYFLFLRNEVIRETFGRYDVHVDTYVQCYKVLAGSIVRVINNFKNKTVYCKQTLLRQSLLFQ